MPNLDIIYDVTIAVTWDEINTNKYVIYQTTCLPSFVIFDAFYFCLWLELSDLKGAGEKALATDHPSWPFLSYLGPLFQNESSCKTFYMKMSLICMKMNL